MGKSKVYLENTTVAASKSIAEIQEILLRANASNINTQAKEGRVIGLAFTLPTSSGDMLFDLPARTEPVYQYLRRQRSPRTIHNTDGKVADAASAERIAWRQLLYWIRAQFALIQIGMVETQEVFMPYAMARNGQRLFEHFKGGGLKQLTGGAQ